MTDTIKLTLTADQAEIVIDALEADLEDYRESLEDARKDSNPQDIAEFSDAAARIESLLSNVRQLLPEEWLTAETQS